MDTDLEIISQEQKLNPAYIYLAGLDFETSRPTQYSSLRQIARKFFHTGDVFACAWGKLRYRDLVLMRAWLQQTRSATTANKYRAALRGVLKAAWLDGQMTAEDYQRAMDVKRIRGEKVAGSMFTPEQERLIFATCTKGAPNWGVRDAAILSLMFGPMGCRRDEISRLSMSDYDEASGRLTITGKGRKQRVGYMWNNVRAALTDWLKIRGSRPGPLFYCILKGDEPFARRISDMSVWMMFKRRLKDAGITRRFTCHDTRRTAISNMIAIGIDLPTIARLVGHTSIETTARYDRRSDKVAEEAAKLLDVPYQKREGL